MHRKLTEKRKETAAYIVMQFKCLKERMGYRKLYCYLANKDINVTNSQVRKALCRTNLQLKVITYYKK